MAGIRGKLEPYFPDFETSKIGFPSGIYFLPFLLGKIILEPD